MHLNNHLEIIKNALTINHIDPFNGTKVKRVVYIK